MRKLYILFLFISTFGYSQTFEQIDKFGSYIGKSFKEFENEQKLKNSGSKLNFGLDNRTYSFNNFFIMVSEEEVGSIGGISYSINIDLEKERSERWYNLVSKFNNDPSYEFISSFVADPEDKITSEDLSFSELIKLLRKSTKTKDWIFEMIFKKANTFTRISSSPIAIGLQTKSITYIK